MRRSAFGPRRLRPALFCVAVLMAAAGCRSRTAVVLSEARFQSLTRIVATATVPLTGLAAGAGDVVIAKADGSIVPAEKIARITVESDLVRIELTAGTFAADAEAAGATVAFRAFYNFCASAPAPIGVASDESSCFFSPPDARQKSVSRQGAEAL